MLKNNKLITDYSQLTFFYEAGAEAYAANYEKLQAQRILKLKPVVLTQVEPFFINGHYFKNLDMNDNRPHGVLRSLKFDDCFDEYDFFDIQTNAFYQLLGFGQKGLTYITYLHKLYLHFFLSFSYVEFTFIDLYFSMLPAIEELALFLKENDQLSTKKVNLNKLAILDIIINYITTYPAFLDLFFAGSNQSLKYKDKGLNLSPELKVKEVLTAELVIFDEYTLYCLAVNLPGTLEQHKVDADIRQKNLHEVFTPILENMLKKQQGETFDPNLPQLVPLDFSKFIKD